VIFECHARVAPAGARHFIGAQGLMAAAMGLKPIAPAGACWKTLAHDDEIDGW